MHIGTNPMHIRKTIVNIALTLDSNHSSNIPPKHIVQNIKSHTPIEISKQNNRPSITKMI